MLFKIINFCYHNFMFKLKIYMHGITNSINSTVSMNAIFANFGIYTMNYNKKTNTVNEI